MAKITLDNTLSGFRSTSVVNANNDLIEAELNDKVLYRDNPAGEANQMESTLDMNSNRVINLPAPISDSEPARWVDVKDGVTVLDTIVLPSYTGNEGRALTTDGADLVFQTATINSADRGSILSYVDNQTQPTYAALRTALAAGDYVVGDSVTIANTTDTSENGQYTVLAIGSYVDNGGTVITGGSFAAVDDTPVVLNAVKFGCLPGLGDCSTALNALMTYARSLGTDVSVYAPGGKYSYNIGAEINIDRVSLFSDPGKAIFTAVAPMTTTDFLVAANGTLSYGDSKHSIQNIEFDGGSLCGGVHLSVRHWGVENCVIKNCDATATTEGLLLERNTQLVRNNHIIDCGIGIHLDGITGATVAASSVLHNHISDCTTAGIKCNEAQNLNIAFNVLQTCGTEIILGDNAGGDFDNVNIAFNYFEDQSAPKTEFILLDPTNANDIEGINIEDNFFYSGNITGMVAVRSNNCEILNFNKNFIRGIPYVFALANSADTSGSYSGNVHSTNVSGIADPADTTTIAALRKFVFGKNKSFNAKVSGTATIASGSATETVTHGLDITPENFLVSMNATTAAVATTGIALYVDNVTSTTFDVNRAGGALTGNIPFTYAAFFGEL